MKKFILCVIFVLVASFVHSQDVTLLQINAKWNQSNNYDLRGLKNCKVRMTLIEDLNPSMRAQIKSLPTIILLDKNGKPRGQWVANLSFKITATKEEIQDRVNIIAKE